MAKIRDIKRYMDRGEWAPRFEWNHLFDQLQEWSSRDSHGCDIDPDFQRSHVWDTPRRSSYIEHCLMGGESSREILFNCAGWGDNYRGPMVLVDGKQRLESIRMWMNNELQAFGLLRGEYEDGERGYRSTEWSIIRVSAHPTRADVLSLYLQINSGGVVHTDEELDRVRELLKKEEGR